MTEAAVPELAVTPEGKPAMPESNAAAEEGAKMGNMDTAASHETIGDIQNKLQAYMEKMAHNDIMVAFSGGVDSGLILQAACLAAKKSGKKVYAVMVHTRLHPAGDGEIAARVAAEMGAEYLSIAIDELDGAGIGENPVDRCYLCKKFLFGRILEEAKKRGIPHLLEGTNADDLHVYRPGIRALRELGVVSPLAELGITKIQVRLLAARYGISVSNRPSSPCLATRFPYGTRLSYEKMEKVDEGERYLRSLGFYNVRLRVHGDCVRIEVDAGDMAKLLSYSKEVTERIKKLGFSYVTLDLEGFRSGSMDVKLV